VLKPNVVLTVAAIPGDGIGIEVIAAGRRVLDAVAETSDDRRDREDDAGWWRQPTSRVRRHLLRRRGLADGSGPRQSMRAAAGHLPGS
jgi:hypothetical protein